MKESVRQVPALTPEKRAQITEIQDFLIDRLVEHREASERGHVWRAQALEGEIEELRPEKENVVTWATNGSN
jgi:hypothetical protein